MWKNFYLMDCLIFISATFVATMFLVISFAESTLLYRKSVANVVFYQSSWMFLWLQTRWFVLLKSMILAIFFAIVFLMGMLQWSLQTTAIMTMDILLIFALYTLIRKYIGVHTKGHLLNIVTRRVVTVVNIIVITPIVVLSLLYELPSETLHSSLMLTLQNGYIAANKIECNFVSMLYALDLFKENMGWWAMYKISNHIASEEVRVLGWVTFLLFQTLYIWIFTKLVLSTTIHFSSIFYSEKEVS